MSELRVAFYGDDFTGSVDVLLQFARHGWSGRLFTGLPDPTTLARAAGEVDVVGIAGISRSLPPEEMERELRPALTGLAALQPRVLQYKVCSTADSSPSVGNLGCVLDLAREIVGVHPVPVLFAQPDFGRYTVFGHHFAAENGVVYRLDRQPTMAHHPSTPMTESDLAVHLSRQTLLPIGTAGRLSAAALADRLRSAPEAAIVLDALTDDDVTVLGQALQLLDRPIFAIGSGGLSFGIAAAAPNAATPLPRSSGVAGPVLTVSGSRSPQSRRQAATAAAAGWLVRPLPLGDDLAAVVDEALAALRGGRGVVLTTDDTDVSTAGARAILDAIADACATAIRAALSSGATRRVIVCGGDTSSRVTRLLGIDALSITANPWGNVVLLRGHSADPDIDGVDLLLKGGQIGSDSLFVDIAAVGSAASV